MAVAPVEVVGTAAAASARVSVDEVGAVSRCDRIGPMIPKQGVVAVVAFDGVVAVVAVYEIVAMSAVDPVATLAIFSSTGADPKLNALVFGESVLNDAVAIVLFKTVVQLGSKARGADALSAARLFGAIGSFCLIFLGSVAIGARDARSNSGRAIQLGTRYHRVKSSHLRSSLS